tara:strand:- start:655 stop:1014 length:360 start_codon:yes stop_codon:yes gene_type:complete
MSEITGVLIVKNETKEYGSNGFTKREFVIEKKEGEYSQKIIFELIKDKCNLIDAFNLGDSLKVSYNLNGRDWTNPQGETKYFNSIVGWRIEKVGESQAAPFEPAGELEKDVDYDDNLPF